MNILEAAKEYLDNVDNGAEYFYMSTHPDYRYKFDNIGFLSESYKDSEWLSGMSIHCRDFKASNWQVHYAEPKLKPCPFCGSEELSKLFNCEFKQFIICANNKCRASTERFSDIKEAITAWNRRDGGEKTKESGACEYCGKTDRLEELLDEN